MIATIVNGTSVFILNAYPLFGNGIDVDVEKLTVGSEGLSLREEREEMASKLRFKMAFAAQLKESEAQALNAALDAWDNRPILVPFWPSERLLTETNVPAITGSLWVYYEPDWSSYEVTSATYPVTFTPSAQCRKAPIMWGRFEELPEPEVATGGGIEEVEFTVFENGSPALALDINTVTLTAGALINGVTPPLLTVPFVWGTNRVARNVRIRRSKIGFGRGDADAYYPHTPRKRPHLEFNQLRSAETRYLLTLFKQSAGSVNPWWVPSPQGKAGTGGNLFGRFFSNTLSLRWYRPARGGDERVDGEVEFLSLPSEQTIPAGEVYGTTIGPRPSRWFGYVVTDGSQTWRFTSYESAIVTSGGTFDPQPISHGRIIEELNLLTHDCTLDVQNWNGNPFHRLFTQMSAAPLRVSIFEGLLSNPDAAEMIFSGVASAPKAKGPGIQVQLIGAASALLGTQGPRSTLQEGCAAVLGDSRCGVNLAAFSKAASFHSIAGALAEFTISPMPADNYFANGSAERTVGGVVQKLAVHDSFALPSGRLGVVLISTPFPAPASGDSWTLVPGCDGQYSTCKNVFGNQVNHRGCPNMPTVNPSMIVIPTTNQAGKKG